jgi:predicted metal-dependent peptidase
MEQRNEVEINNAIEKIKKAKIKLQSRSPFFAYLSCYLKMYRAKENDLPDYAGIGVSANGNLYFNEKWINKLTDEEMIGVLAHEIGHLALLHLVRRKNRDMEKWNIACDLVINSMLLKNNFSLVKGGLNPDYNDTFNFPEHIFGKKVKVTEVNKKIAEDIFDELPEIEGDDKGSGNGRWDLHSEDDGEGEGDGEGDKQGKGKGGKGRKLTPAEMKELEEKWKDRIEEAIMNSKARGNLPSGMERYFDELRKNQVNWKALLQRYVQETIPRDFTWAKKSKKSVACNTYLPSVTKEKIDVIVTIDVSGSIGQKELVDFISEIVGMARAFQDNINMRLLVHDTDVQNDYEIKNGNVEKIKRIQIKGGGGTSHDTVFDYIKEKIKRTKAVICFTDGYSNLSDMNFNDYPFEKIFVINKGGSDEQVRDKKCKIIMMKD